MDENKINDVKKEHLRQHQLKKEELIPVYQAYGKYGFSKNFAFALDKKYKNENKTMREWEKIFMEKGLI
jgi:ribosomal protein L15